MGGTRTFSAIRCWFFGGRKSCSQELWRAPVSTVIRIAFFFLQFSFFLVVVLYFWRRSFALPQDNIDVVALSIAYRDCDVGFLVYGVSVLSSPASSKFTLVNSVTCDQT